jgi:anti-sigma-K factor RskA
MSHEEWTDTAAAYVLGALPDEERAGFEAHLTTCAECRSEVDELGDAVALLPASAPAMRPSPALKTRIMADVEREAALLAAAGPQADRPPVKTQRRERRRWFAVPQLGFALATLIVGVVVGALVFQGGGSTTVDFKGSGSATQTVAQLSVTGDKAVLTAEHLPAAGSGRTYQVWLLKKGETAPEPTSALFTPRKDGTATATVEGKLRDGDQVLVTSEPDGGSPAPTSDPILGAKLT